MKNWEAKLFRFALKNQMSYCEDTPARVALYTQKWIYTLNLFNKFRSVCTIKHSEGSDKFLEFIELQILTGLRCNCLEVQIKARKVNGRETLLIKNREIRRGHFLGEERKGSAWIYQYFDIDGALSEDFVVTQLNRILFKFLN
jgi:hypothetical protein